MKKKGFTLIELLAVIVILAIIVLIATPLIMNIITSAKEESIKRSVEQIQNTAETMYTTGQIKNPDYVFNQSDVKYKGEQFKDITMGVNTKGDASVAIHKNNKCYYALNGDRKVSVDTTDKDECLAKANGGNTDKPLILKYCDTTVTTECFKPDGNYTGATGTVGNNWLWYGGHLWRIMNENKSEKSLTLITSYPTTAIFWGEWLSLSDNCIVNGTCSNLEQS